MDESPITPRDNNLITWGPNILALISVFAGVFFSLDALESPRPNSESSNTVTPEASNEVYKRLWEDPFDLEATNTSAETPTAASKKVGDSRQLNLVVSFNEEPTFDATETRIRARYAIVSALLSAGYIESLTDRVIVGEISQQGAEQAPDSFNFANNAGSNDKTEKEANSNTIKSPFVVIEQFHPTDLVLIDDANRFRLYHDQESGR